MNDPLAFLHDPELSATGLREGQGYAEIAREEARIVARTGLLGAGAAFAGRQAVARHFLGGFASPAQRARWLDPIIAGRGLAAVSISEPGVGAHPKHLCTRATRSGDGWCISGHKAWTSNGPLATVFVVLAITGERDGRKRYSAFLVPRETAGLAIEETEQYRALEPSRHCGLVLNECQVSADALLGQEGAAYETMALPFRDIEDGVGLSGLAGACRFAAAILAENAPTPDSALSVGAIVALSAVLQQGAERVADALDAGRVDASLALAVGLRVLAADMAARIRTHASAHLGAADPRLDRLLRDMERARSVARFPREARQAKLARAIAIA